VLRGRPFLPHCDGTAQRLAHSFCTIRQEKRVKLVIRSWYLARSLGVTKSPPEAGVDYIAVEVEGGPMLFWPVVGKADKATI
jgi:hypothetical protein